jgi:hypothetical protein
MRAAPVGGATRQGGDSHNVYYGTKPPPTRKGRIAYSTATGDVGWTVREMRPSRSSALLGRHLLRDPLNGAPQLVELHRAFAQEAEHENGPSVTDPIQHDSRWHLASQGLGEGAAPGGFPSETWSRASSFFTAGSDRLT